jgi:DNA gyrase subunit A
VLNQLFKHTAMQEGFSMILLAVVNGQPREMGLIQAIKHFINHRVDVVRRRTAYSCCKKRRDREHILEGYLNALDHLDNVITIIRASANRADARENLVAYFGGKKIDINTTGRAPRSSIPKSRSPRAGRSHSRTATASPDQALHRRNFQRIERSCASASKSTNPSSPPRASSAKSSSKSSKKSKSSTATSAAPCIEDEAAEIMLEDLIADEQVAVTFSHSGYMKRTPISTYRMQRRGGTGRTGMKTRDEDFVEHLFIASTHAYILIFTNKGRVYWLKVYEIPDVSAAGKGKHIGNLIGLQPGETVRTMLAVRNLEEESKYIFFATRNGLVKKSELKRVHARPLQRHQRHQHRRRRRTGRRAHHQRQSDRLHRLPRRHGRSASTKITSAPWDAPPMACNGINLVHPRIGALGAGCEAAERGAGDRVAAAVVIPPEEPNGNGTLLQ